jgi:CubicO group peptidase (beta-lactamase class C family)
VEFMTSNQLPATGAAAASMQPGLGYGLGVSVLLDPCSSRALSSAGEWGRDGHFGTSFFVDPAEDLAVLQLSQIMPAGRAAGRLQRELHSLVYQALL